MPSPKIPHYTKKKVQCPICGAFMRTTQGLNGHMRFRHTAKAIEKGMLWKMQNDGFLPVIDYPGLTPDDLDSWLVLGCYKVYLERLESGKFSPRAPRIPKSELLKVKEERYVRSVIELGTAMSQLKTSKLNEEIAQRRDGRTK